MPGAPKSEAFAEGSITFVSAAQNRNPFFFGGFVGLAYSLPASIVGSTARSASVARGTMRMERAAWFR